MGIVSQLLHLDGLESRVVGRSRGSGGKDGGLGKGIIDGAMHTLQGFFRSTVGINVVILSVGKQEEQKEGQRLGWKWEGVGVHAVSMTKL